MTEIITITPQPACPVCWRAICVCGREYLDTELLARLDEMREKHERLRQIVVDLFPTLVVLAHDEGQRVLSPPLVEAIRTAVTALTVPGDSPLAHD